MIIIHETQKPPGLYSQELVLSIRFKRHHPGPCLYIAGQWQWSPPEKIEGYNPKKKRLNVLKFGGVF